MTSLYTYCVLITSRCWCLWNSPGFQWKLLVFLDLSGLSPTTGGMCSSEPSHLLRRDRFDTFTDNRRTAFIHLSIKLTPSCFHFHPLVLRVTAVRGGPTKQATDTTWSIRLFTSFVKCSTLLRLHFRLNCPVEMIYRFSRSEGPQFYRVLAQGQWQEPRKTWCYDC